MLKELKITSDYPMKILCDNKAAISIAKNHVHHDMTKHMEIDRHFIEEKIDSRVANLEYIPSSQQTADILTRVFHSPPMRY